MTIKKSKEIPYLGIIGFDDMQAFFYDAKKDFLPAVIIILLKPKERRILHYKFTDFLNCLSLAKHTGCQFFRQFIKFVNSHFSTSFSFFF